MKEICSFEARAHEKEDLDKMVDYIENFAKNENLSVKRTRFDKCGDFLTIDINETAEKSYVFMAHMDTVHDKGVFGYPAVRIEEDKMIGPGTIDCKGGIAIGLFTLKALQESGFKKHARLILTSDEEVSNTLGGEEEMMFFKESTRTFKGALNCETSTDNEVVVSRKGILRYRIDICGKGGHSGIAYFNTSNAVLEAAHKIIELQKHSVAGGNTYSCNIINGGSVGNIIPEKCSFVLDIRANTHAEMAEAEQVVEEITNKSYVSGTSATAVKLSSRIPMVKNDETLDLFNRLQTICEKYNLSKLKAVESGGGSDSAYTQAAGVPSICGLGGVGEFCHTNREYIDIKSIAERTKLLSAFCVEF